MLLCCSNETLAAPGVLEEIDIATDLSKELNDPRFILPLRIRPYKKIFGIAGLQYTDFVRGWAEGLEKLLASLKRQKVPCNAEAGVINPTWEIYRRRQAITLKNEPERLTSNWLRILKSRISSISSSLPARLIGMLWRMRVRILHFLSLPCRRDW
jgi:hypothetical protein